LKHLLLFSLFGVWVEGHDDGSLAGESEKNDDELGTIGKSDGDATTSSDTQSSE